MEVNVTEGIPTMTELMLMRMFYNLLHFIPQRPSIDGRSGQAKGNVAKDSACVDQVTFHVVIEVDTPDRADILCGPLDVILIDVNQDWGL